MIWVIDNFLTALYPNDRISLLDAFHLVAKTESYLESLSLNQTLMQRLSTLVEAISTSDPEQGEDAAKWLNELRQASNEKRFFFMLFEMIAIGTKV